MDLKSPFLGIHGLSLQPLEAEPKETITYEFYSKSSTELLFSYKTEIKRLIKRLEAAFVLLFKK